MSVNLLLTGNKLDISYTGFRVVCMPVPYNKKGFPLNVFTNMSRSVFIHANTLTKRCFDFKISS